MFASRAFVALAKAIGKSGKRIRREIDIERPPERDSRGARAANEPSREKGSPRNFSIPPGPMTLNVQKGPDFRRSPVCTGSRAFKHRAGKPDRH